MGSDALTASIALGRGFLRGGSDGVSAAAGSSAVAWSGACMSEARSSARHSEPGRALTRKRMREPVARVTQNASAVTSAHLSVLTWLCGLTSAPCACLEAETLTRVELQPCQPSAKLVTARWTGCQDAQRAKQKRSAHLALTQTRSPSVPPLMRRPRERFGLRVLSRVHSP